MANLYQLVYTSYISPDVHSTGLAEILRDARLHNRDLNITGVLVFDGLRICQYLEGPREVLLPLVETIRADPRHLEFKFLEQGSAGAKLFGDWAMGFARCHAVDDLDRLHKFNGEGGLSAAASLALLVASLNADLAGEP